MGQVVLQDLREAQSPLIVSGYASLERIVRLLADLDAKGGPVRLLFGVEPHATGRERFALQHVDFPTEVRDYWLAHGISVDASASLIHAIGLIESGRVEARHLGGARKRLHAKIYCGEKGVTLGSSNFTDSGLSRQLEANVRFTTKEPRRFHEARRIAENFWAQGRPYRDELLALLRQLLAVVSWQEALARACAELLDGDWARAYLGALELESAGLWPSQVQGIAEALWLMENVGSVLVADATGSGKTRMGAHLIRAAVDRIWSSGRMRKGRPLMVCPPAVRHAWEAEAQRCDLPLVTLSHGVLSRAAGSAGEQVEDALRRAQVLAVDEAHNFLNLASRRTRMVLSNMADHTLLFTATPINRSVVDLLRIADTLGADNLAPETLTMFEGLLRSRRLDRSLSPGELAALRQELERFTVRRTKRELNALVDQNPEAYRDAAGRPCRYPRHRSHVYKLGESNADQALAAKIRTLSGKLRGLLYLRGALEMPAVLQREHWDAARYLESRLKSARMLPAYVVSAALRSSRAALTEHLRGTAFALEHFGLAGRFNKPHVGNVIDKLREIRGQVPENRLGIPLPDWLTDPDAHAQACDEERSLYEAMWEALAQLSDGRERAKAKLLTRLLCEHDLVLAFDSRPITLAVIRAMLEEMGDARILLATGDTGSDRREIAETLRPGSQRQRVVALCSDSLAEGVNLQQASTIVHLDMPSVVRVAEQRVGRVDRMDSPHEAIDAWWPDDAPAFALSSDERFIERFETVENLLGSNLPLPEEMLGRGHGPVQAEELIREFEAQADAEPWDGIRDAFQPVRDLVLGPRAMVPPQVMDAIQRNKQDVLARIAAVRSTEAFGFFCLSGDDERAPKWVLLRPRAHGARPLVDADLHRITARLRRLLTPHSETLPLDDQVQGQLSALFADLHRAEREILPRRKRRALDEMEKVLQGYARRFSEPRMKRIVNALLMRLRQPDAQQPPNWDALAERWLDLIRPVWYRHLGERRRGRPLLLRDIRRDLLGEDCLSAAALEAAFADIPEAGPLEARLAACIVGVPERRTPAGNL
ncbi:helicase [Thioalkalivibrio denitrificans]|uniref:Helicase n=1 Tax=Thioalkalivibrio denitrificans TaxID=108003 RepID=A0A1V3NIM6_9GAMM|nr:helicase [Thioalkalivibrio denitrificans]